MTSVRPQNDRAPQRETGDRDGQGLSPPVEHSQVTRLLARMAIQHVLGRLETTRNERHAPTTD